MSQVQVQAAELRDCAAAMLEAAQMTGSCALPESLDALGDALPGSHSGHAARDLAATWQELTTRWQRAAAAHGESVQDGARDYDAADSAVAARHDRLAHRLAQPVVP